MREDNKKDALNDGFTILAIAALRKERNLTQSVVSEEIGMSQNAYSRLERGETKLTINKFDKICDFLEVSYKEVIELSQKIRDKKEGYQMSTSVPLIDLYENAIDEIRYLREIVESKNQIISLLEYKIKNIETQRKD